MQLQNILHIPKNIVLLDLILNNFLLKTVIFKDSDLFDLLVIVTSAKVPTNMTI